MELMNYNKHSKKSPKLGIFSFLLFTCLGTSMVFYMIKNEPKPKVLGEDMYIPVGSGSVYEEDDEVNIYSEEYLRAIKYKVSKSIDQTTKGNLKLNLSVPVITVDGVELEEVNDAILAKFTERYEAVMSEADSLENKFTYKVTYNVYESMLNTKRVLSFTFYERIIDDLTGQDTTYKLYGTTIDLATKKVLSQSEVGPDILGTTYKTTIKSKVKEKLITDKLYTIDNYSYTMTGLEEFYVKDAKLHIMFNPGELGSNKDYIDIAI